MNLKSKLLKLHKVILYLTTYGLVVYGILAIFSPEILAGGFTRFTKQDWTGYQIDSPFVAAYVILLWRLIGGFNLAIGIVLTFIAWKWLQPGHVWAWTALLLGTLIAYLSPMSLDLSVRSIEFFEVIEFLLFGLFVMSMLLVRKEYLQPDIGLANFNHDISI